MFQFNRQCLQLTRVSPVLVPQSAINKLYSTCKTPTDFFQKKLANQLICYEKERLQCLHHSLIININNGNPCLLLALRYFYETPKTKLRVENSVNTPQVNQHLVHLKGDLLIWFYSNSLILWNKNNLLLVGGRRTNVWLL